MILFLLNYNMVHDPADIDLRFNDIFSTAVNLYGLSHVIKLLFSLYKPKLAYPI